MHDTFRTLKSYLVHSLFQKQIVHIDMYIWKFREAPQTGVKQLRYDNGWPSVILNVLQSYGT